MAAYNVAIVYDNAAFLKKTEEAVLKAKNCKLIGTVFQKPSELSKSFSKKPDIFIISTDLGARDIALNCEHLKKSYPDAEILVVSGAWGTPAMKRLFASSASAFLPMPYSVADLEEAVLDLYEEPLKSRYFPKVSFAAVSNLLLGRGFNPKHSGFMFLAKVICLLSEYTRKPMITDVYARAAEVLCTTPAAVESSARAEIRDLYKKQGKEIPELSDYAYGILNEARKDLR